MDPTSLALGFGKSFLFVLATILPILNPPTSSTMVLGLTEGASAETRRVLARKVARNVFLLLLGAMLVGSYVLDLFGISLPIVRVGGGLIVASTAWRLLNVDHATRDSRQALAEGFTLDHVQRQAFYPLTFPMTCGPGSITAAITVGVTLPEGGWALTLSRVAGGVLALVLLGGMVYLAHRYAQRLLRFLGETGTIVFLRLSAFILLCLGVQIVWDGVRELLRSV
ncbi:MAG: NAAT family transporter [Burkholderiales bacterium]|nr:NAAT family transporter [Burkholderiales bacterium]